MIIHPIIWGLLGVVAASPVLLVVIGGILNALYLVAVSVACIYLSFKETDPRIRDGKVFTAYLLISAVAIVAVGVISLYNVLF